MFIAYFFDPNPEPEFHAWSIFRLGTYPPYYWELRPSEQVRLDHFDWDCP